MQLTEICEVVTSILGVIIAFIGLVLIVIGWIIPYKQNLELESKKNKAEQAFQRVKWEKEMIDEQIAHFYGPISALLKQHAVVRHKVFEQFGRHYIFDNKHPTFNYLSDKEQRIWAHYNDNYKLPIMNSIIKIIKENYHLIYNSIMPHALIIFMDYALGWELLDDQKRNHVPNGYNYHYERNFPYEFEEHISAMLEMLQVKRAELIKELESS